MFVEYFQMKTWTSVVGASVAGAAVVGASVVGTSVVGAGHQHVT